MYVSENVVLLEYIVIVGSSGEGVGELGEKYGRFDLYFLLPVGGYLVTIDD